MIRTRSRFINPVIEFPVVFDTIYVHGTGDAAADAQAIQAGLDKASETGKSLTLVGRFLIRLSTTVVFNWANAPRYPTCVTIYLRSNVKMFGINCTIEIEPLAAVPANTDTKFLVFGTLQNVAPDTLVNLAFSDMTFDYNNSRGPLNSQYIYSFGIIGATNLERRNIKFITSTDNYNGRGILAANVHRWTDINIDHNEIIQGYFLNYCYDVTLDTIGFNLVAECIDVDAPCWRFNISNITATNLRGDDSSLFDFATLSDSVITGVRCDNHSAVIEYIGNKPNSFATFDLWLAWDAPKACSVSVASPGVVTRVNHGLAEGAPFGFIVGQETSGTPAPPLAHETLYWARNVTADTLNVSATVRELTLPTDPFTSTAASAVLTISDTAHGMSSGQWVRYNGAREFDGIPADELNDDHVVTVLDADTYTIAVTTPATAGVAGGGSSVYARYQQLVDTVSPDVGVPGIKFCGDLVTCDNLVITGITGSNGQLGRPQVVIGQVRETTAGQYWRGANPRLAVNGLVMSNISLDGGRRFLINEGTDIKVDGMILRNMQPDTNETLKGAFTASQSFGTDTLAQLESAVDLEMSNVLVDGSTATGVSLRDIRNLSAHRVTVKNYGSASDSFARNGFNISALGRNPGSVNLGELRSSGGIAGATDFLMSSSGGTPQHVNFTGPFAFKTNSAGSANVAPISGVTINTRSTMTLPAVTSIGGSGTTLVPIYQNNSQHARLLAASIVNLEAITGNATDYTTINLVKSAAGVTTTLATALAIDSASQTACTSRDFTINVSDARAVLAPGEVLYAQFARGGSGSGSAVPSLVLNWYALPYDGPVA